MLKFTQIGFTCEMVVILVVVPTRSPICELELPGDAVNRRIDLRPGEVQLGIVQSRLIRQYLGLRAV